MRFPALLQFQPSSVSLRGMMPSANDKLSDPPYLLAPFQADSDSPGTDVVHHHGARFINPLSHFANAYRTDHGISVQPRQRRIVRPGDFASYQAGTVLQR